MASWLDQWGDLTARIAQLTELAFRCVDASAAMSSDVQGLEKAMVVPPLQEVYDDLGAFLTTHESAMPTAAAVRLKQLRERSFKFHGRLSGRALMIALATSLSVIRTQLDPLMQDTDLPRVHIAERAFLHLQRLIVADETVRVRWRGAYDSGEVACEKLGGAHLLHHGIYAVKSNAAGERTDLVLGTRLAITPLIQRAADAMALTEWKLVRDPKQLDAVVDEARKQAARYVAGSLAGFEIASVRFLVTVSEDVLTERADEVAGAVTYRHVNVAVAPRVPSRS